MKWSEKNELISKALVKIQAEMTDVKKNSENPFLQSTYADLPAVLKVARPIITKHGCCIFQVAENPDGKPMVITRFIHESGEWVEADLNIAVPANLSEKTNFIQRLGSIITYLRRYQIQAMCGMGAEDDDGVEADTLMPNVDQNKSKKVTTSKEITLEDRLKALPQDLKDLLVKAKAITIQQQYGVMKSVDWNTDAAKKACLKQITDPR